jgi:hypothetical protein
MMARLAFATAALALASYAPSAAAFTIGIYGDASCSQVQDVMTYWVNTCNVYGGTFGAALTYCDYNGGSVTIYSTYALPPPCSGTPYLTLVVDTSCTYNAALGQYLMVTDTNCATTDPVAVMVPYNDASCSDPARAASFQFIETSACKNSNPFYSYYSRYTLNANGTVTASLYADSSCKTLINSFPFVPPTNSCTPAVKPYGFPAAIAVLPAAPAPPPPAPAPGATGTTKQ